MLAELCACTVFALWVAINVADGWWIYYYVQSNVDPIPSHVVGKSVAAINTFAAMMFLFGALWGMFHGAMVKACLEDSSSDVCDCEGDVTVLGVLCRLLAFFIVLFFVWMPFLGGWIVEGAVHSKVWNHRCDSFPAFVILDARSPDETNTPNVANYFINQPSSAKPTQLFTYEITDANNATSWAFNLLSWQAPQQSIPLPFYPTLQSIHYDLANRTVNGSCTLSAEDSTAVVPCMSGTFDPSAHLFFNITSAVPLNDTLPTSYPAAVPNVTSLLAIPGNGWAFKGHQPALQLQEQQPSGSLGDIVLRTATTKPSDKTQLKVCINGPSGRQGAAVQPEVLVPLGLVLMLQADYAGVVAEIVAFDPDNADGEGGKKGKGSGGRGGD